MCRVIAVLLACTLGAAWVHGEAQERVTVVQGEIPQKDASRPRYRVILPDKQSRGGVVVGDDGDSGWERVSMVSATGQKLKCTVPTAAPVATAPAAESLGPDSYDDVSELLRGYRNKCFVRQEQWWSFEFCYGDKVVQFHEAVSKDDKAARFVLGKFNAEFDLARPVAQVPRAEAPYTQLLGNGTLCDVTGQPRQILVKYICADDTSQMSSIARHTGDLFLVKAIREVETCVYELDFISSAICDQKLYRETKRQSSIDIECSLQEAVTFWGLEARWARKGKASLTL